jgi:L-Lysine epsilon oxidase N-terminal/L-lysine epsilon oxidase C-terminal domain/Iron-containing redox enzyme
VNEQPIAYCAVFPRIGIARVGDSKEFFIGPEAPGIPSDPPGGFKDRHGFIKRQAARFRVYGFDAQGNVVKELTSKNTAAIKWRVSLANKKASWYEFDGAQTALDILEGRSPKKRPAVLRNADWPGDRRELVMKSTGEVSGENEKSPPFLGAVYGQREPVYLGELKTDECGRLLMLGGHGHSGSTQNDEAHLITHYANNDGWYDDTSDGPVEVEVHLTDATAVPAKGRAWVIVGPPDFSPHTQNLVTLFDVIEDTALQNGLEWHPAAAPPPLNRTRVSFVDDVYPILRRVVDLQWVNGQVARGHGAGKKMNFLTDATLGLLADDKNKNPGSTLRQRIFSLVRDPMADHDSAVLQANYFYMPQLAGDEGHPIMGEPDRWLKVARRQYETLRLWKNDAFDGFSSFDELQEAINKPAVPLDQLPLGDQPFALTKGALLPCVGGAFYPGIEMTSIARSKTLYKSAFELSDQLEAGDVTKWMALPWQADFFECNTHWWPAQRPDDVVSEYDFRDAMKKFEIERDAGALDMLLFPRKKWARGVDVGRTLRPNFDWPEPEEDETVANFAGRCHDAFVTFAHANWRYHDRRWRLPGPKKDESIDRYQYRLREFFDRYSGKLGVKGERWHFALPDATDGELSSDYRGRVADAFKAFIDALPPAPISSETTEAFVVRLKAGKTWNGFVASTTQRGYEVRQDKLGDNQMVFMWKELGFVVPATGIEERILVETGRGKYDGLRDRDYFYITLNYSEFPDFEAKARQLVHKFLSDAKAVQRTAAFKSDPDQRVYEHFKYSPSAVEARLQEIYNQLAAEAAAANGDPEWRRQDIIARALQLAPFNQLDGAWLRYATQAGPISDVNAFLFSIWSDETGNGDPALNHANLYTALLQSLGIYLPDLRSRAYADNDALFDSSFTLPVFELVISQFSEEFFPEILGMTLQLEWEVLSLWPTVKRLERKDVNINAQFYRMHIGIDNASDGHGALAKRAVQQYLDYIRERSGPEEVEKQWDRIWTGYAAFATLGDISNDLEIQRDYPRTVEQRMLALVERKRPVAELNHGNSSPPLKFGNNRLNDWFKEPQAFLDALAASDYIAAGDPDASKLLNDKTTYSGPMYKVFTSDELKLWADWIRWLGKGYADQAPPTLDPASRMKELVARMAARAVDVGAHKTRQLTGTLDGQEKSQSVSDWFAAGPVPLMRALANAANGLVTPGDAAKSTFVTDVLANAPPMATAIAGVVIDGKTGTTIINDWINDGCKLPAEPAPSLRVAGLEAVSLLETRRPVSITQLLARREGLYQRQVFGPDAVH